MSENRIAMTREGYEKLKGELAQLDVAMIEVTKRVAAARDLGDLSENAEYHAAREDQGMLQAKVDMLRHKLSHAEIVDLNSLPKDAVVFGCKVRILDMQYDEEEVFELVGPGEDNPDQNKILTTSPIGMGLLGKKKGDIAEVVLPKGVAKFKVLAISFEH